MNTALASKLAALGCMALAATAAAAPPSPSLFQWSTVANNTDDMPVVDGCAAKKFNSYNQPSVNVYGLVVMRARSRGGEGMQPAEQAAAQVGENCKKPIHGIYTRDMGVFGSPIVKILDRTTAVPQPNNARYPPSNPSLTQFVETPSFPRIDMGSSTIATRGNHQPVWVYGDTRAGTTGVYANPYGALITGASKLGAVPDFEYFAVPGVSPPTMFDVFPGAPAVANQSTIVFKGNYTIAGVGRTGVFYRYLADAQAGGTGPTVLIANNTTTYIPGTTTLFGSTSPPSAVNGMVVFAGFDNEENPTLGGLYLAPIAPTPPLTTLVSIGGRVPGEGVNTRFTGLGEGAAFDGRYVAFWGSWGSATRTLRLYCPTEGNKDRIAYCNQNLVCGDGTIERDPNSTCDATGCWQERQVPVNQGVFVHDTLGGRTRTIAKTPARFDDFLFWNYSGKTPCVGGGHSEEGAEDDGEPARWRSAAFVTVSGLSAAFKARTGSIVGVYYNGQPGQDIFTVADTRTLGQSLDPEAPYGSLVTEVGLEREGLRGNWLAISAKMAVEGGTEEDGMAGVYITRVPR